jgi:uncharacterized protein YbjT (DUF2867 family)
MEGKKTIFVTGGTGNQGGAVARNLSQQGFAVKVLTRNAGSSKALNLKKSNIQLVEGDLNNADTYREYLKNVYGVFSVHAIERGTGKEIKQGITLATLANEFGVKHYLYSSAFGVDLNTGVPHLDSKLKIENHIKQIGIPFTIIRPTSLYENFLIPQVKKGILKGKLVQAIKRDTVLKYISAEDIGKIGAEIFQHTDGYLGRTISLGTEKLSTQQVADTFSEVLNKKVEYKRLPTLITRLFLGNSLYKMFKWLDENEPFLKEDKNSTLEEFPGLLSLKTWIGMNFKS